MKRLLAVMFLMVFLAGCGQTETPVSAAVDNQPLTAEMAPVDKSEFISEPAVPMVQKPETIVNPEAGENAAPVSAMQQEPEADQHTELARMAAAVYEAITKDRAFTAYIEDTGGDVTTLYITPENAWNAEGVGRTFEWAYQWSAASAADWQAQLASEERGYRLTFAASEDLAISCCSGGDIIEVVEHDAVTYLRAVNPKEGGPFEWKLYGALAMIAEDAIGAQVWEVTVDGALEPVAAAEQLVKQVAENYRNVPEWVKWKPLDIQPDGANVYDIYKGDPQQFCCGVGLRVKLEDFDGVNAGYWQAGAGLSEADEEGYYGWGCGVYVTKNAEGAWCYDGYGTGGVFVQPPIVWEKATIEELVEVFCLTEGNTHEYFAPNFILQLPAEELAKLPGILDQLTEAEITDLCTTLRHCLREYDYWEWTVDTLKPVLGSYGALLDA